MALMAMKEEMKERVEERAHVELKAFQVSRKEVFSTRGLLCGVFLLLLRGRMGA